MTKSERIAQLLIEAGFEPTSDFQVRKGPKVKSDILECWNVNARHKGKHVTIYSADTMTQLCKTGLSVELNHKDTCLYGDYIAYPKVPAIKTS